MSFDDSVCRIRDKTKVKSVFRDLEHRLFWKLGTSTFCLTSHVKYTLLSKYCWCFRHEFDSDTVDVRRVQHEHEGLLSLIQFSAATCG